MELNDYAQNLNTTMSGAEDMTELVSWNGIKDDFKGLLN